MSGKSSRTSQKTNLGLLILLASSILGGCASVSLNNQNQNQSQGGNGGNVGNITQKDTTNPQSDLDATPQPNTPLSANSKAGDEFLSKLKPDGESQSFREQAPRFNPEQIGELQGTRIFEDRLTTEKKKQCYGFSLRKSSNASFYVDRITAGASVFINLVVDTNNNGVVDDGENEGSKTVYGGGSIISIDRLIGKEDPYSFCVEFNRRNTNYRLQLVNNLSEVEQLTPFTPQSGSLSDTNIQDSYQFKLDHPQSVSLDVSQNTEPVQIYLYGDNNSNGVIDESEKLSSLTRYSGKDRKIENTLSKGTYFIILSRSERNTDYKLTISAQ